MSEVLPLITRRGDRVAIVGGLRTPFARQATAYHGVPAVDLGKIVVNELLIRTGIDPELIELLVFGQVVQCRRRPISPGNCAGNGDERAYRRVQRIPRLRHQFSGGGQRGGKHYGGRRRGGDCRRGGLLLGAADRGE